LRRSPYREKGPYFLARWKLPPTLQGQSAGSQRPPPETHFQVLFIENRGLNLFCLNQGIGFTCIYAKSAKNTIREINIELGNPGTVVSLLDLGLYLNALCWTNLGAITTARAFVDLVEYQSPGSGGKIILASRRHRIRIEFGIHLSSSTDIEKMFQNPPKHKPPLR
jgi:hypothetical protein